MEPLPESPHFSIEPKRSCKAARERGGKVTKIIKEDKARQGRRGQQVLYVLIAALILAAIAWFGAELYGTSIDPSGTEVQTVPDPA